MMIQTEEASERPSWTWPTIWSEKFGARQAHLLSAHSNLFVEEGGEPKQRRERNSFERQKPGPVTGLFFCVTKRSSTMTEAFQFFTSDPREPMMSGPPWAG